MIKYVCHVVQVNSSDYCDTLCIDTLEIVSIPLSLFCILRYGDASMYHPISTSHYEKITRVYTLQKCKLCAGSLTYTQQGAVHEQ